MPPKKPSPKVQAVLDRAKQGHWLTKAETELLLGHNQGYTFRYVLKDQPRAPKDKAERDAWEKRTFELSLTDTEARWRMLGRSEPIQQPLKNYDEFISLYVTQNEEGGYDWDVVDEYDEIVKGKEPTAFRAAIVGGRAYEVELYKRQFVEPEDFLAVAKPEEVVVPWTLSSLVKWAAEKIADADVEGPGHTSTLSEDILDFLLELKYEDEPKAAYAAIRAYRKLNAKARLHKIKSLLKTMGLPEET